MTASINRLSSETVKLIKSTQVITSVCSVVKELVENSLDANARNIEVTLLENGFSLIEVKDDGLGISKQDAEYMALSSYTSKIKDFNDLDLLSTYGFRGEGLSAICKVAEVVISTKCDYDALMTSYKLDSNGLIVDQETSHGLTGTVVQVKNLFNKFPVRKTHLSNSKRINQEMKKIELLLKSFAICQPKNRYVLKVNRNTIFTKTSCKNYSEAVRNVLGVQIYSNLHILSHNLADIKIILMTPRKELKDYKDVVQNGYQFLLINNRPIKSKDIEKKISKRLGETFNSNSSITQKFIYCLILNVNPSMLDINLEPNKEKVLLHNENLVMDEIDNLLLKYYELQSSQISQISSEGNVESNIVADSDTQWPACKKRKLNHEKTIDVNNISSSCETIDSVTECDSDFLKRFSCPILSESESNEDDTDLELKKKQVEDKSISTFSKDKESLHQTRGMETLSQLPKVDLGDDFDFEEILKKDRENENLRKKNESCNNIVNKKQELMPENCLDDDIEFDETIKLNGINNLIKDNEPKIFNYFKNDRAEESDIISWSKGQVPGLQAGVTLDMLQRNEHTETFEKQVNDIVDEQFDSEPFDYLKNVQEKVKNINNSYNNVLNNKVDSVNISDFNWEEINNKKEKQSTPLKTDVKSQFISAKKHLNWDVDVRNKKSEQNSSHVFLNKQKVLPFAGDNAGFGSIGTFATFCKEVRPDIVKSNPGFTNAEVASELQSRWKNISPEERGFYRDLALKNLKESSSLVLESIQNSQVKISKSVSLEEKEKNKKHLVSMLENMKIRRNDVQNMLLRTSRPWNVSVQSVTDKLKRPAEKLEKLVVGPINSNLFIVNYGLKFLLFDIKKVFNQLKRKDFQSNVVFEESNITLIFQQWFQEVKDRSLWYEIIDKAHLPNLDGD